MIRFVTLLAVSAVLLFIAVGGAAGAYDGVAMLAVTVTGFGLLIGLVLELMRLA